MRSFVTGYVCAPHGLDGTFKVKSASDTVEHITRLKRITVRLDDEEKAFDVERARSTVGFALMKVHGVDSPEAARELAGGEIVVDENEARQCADGEWYADDLIGCSVMYGESVVGKVSGVTEGGAGNLLEVEMNGECEALPVELRRTSKGNVRRVMVPFTGEHIGQIDAAAGRMQLLNLWVLE